MTIAAPSGHSRLVHGMRRTTGGALRLLLATGLALRIVPALVAPELPLLLRLTAGVLLLLAAWRPAPGLALTVVLLPAGLIFAGVPARASELFAWSFLCGWLAAIWRPLGPTTGLPRGIVSAAAVYGACLTASWADQTLSSAAGIAPGELAGFLMRALPTDHLIFSSPAPESWAGLNAVTGLAMFLAALSLARQHARLPSWISVGFVASMTVLAITTIIQLLREWASLDYGSWFLIRYLQGHRFSAHMADLNAAGSQYLLAGLIAAAGATALYHRRRWISAMVLMLPAFWLSGSRSAAIGGILVGAIAVIGSQRSHTAGLTRMLSRTPTWVKGSAAAAVVIAVGVAVASAALETGQHPGARDSLRMRSLFLQTSARMFASAPVHGVGVGQYLPRSAEFMPPALRAVYPFENAHNYFAQQFAELGLVGGLAFLALIAAGMAAGWRATRDAQTRTVTTGLFAASAAYLLTCVTGHPLLVPEAALPFWVIFGLASGLAPPRPPPRLARPAAAVAGALLIGSVGASANDALRLPAAPLDRGVHDQRVSDDGVTYRWTTRHAVLWVPPDIGFLTIPIRAPELPDRARPFRAQVEIDGRVIKTATAASDHWSEIGISLRTRGPNARRRVDLRVNQVWTPKRDRGDNVDDRPMGIMVGPVTLQTLPVTPLTLPPSQPGSRSDGAVSPPSEPNDVGGGRTP